MESQSLFKQPIKRWLLLIAVWNLVGLAFVVQYLVYHFADGVPFRWDQVVWTMLGWYIWIPLTPFITWLARRFPVEQNRWLRRVGLHLLIATAISACEVAFYSFFQVPYRASLGMDVDPIRLYRILFLRSLFFDVLFYSVIVAIVHAFDNRKKYHEQDLKLAHLETQLVEAQLHALRTQLNPHFLFNTLHTISAMMDENVKAARRTMADLSDLLRQSLDNMQEQLVRLRQELVFLERYLSIEKERLQERLIIRMEVEENCLDALVPNLILQPLVENAIKHGIAPFAAGGEIVIQARCEGEMLTLQVADNGPGLLPGTAIFNGASDDEEKGIGLQTTRERLLHLYGEEGRFELQNRPEGGLVVTLTFPLYTEVLESVG